jgi:phage shock protein E
MMKSKPVMQNNRRISPFMVALLLMLTIWLINPAMAGNGDTETAQQAWPMIEQGALLIDVRTEEEFISGHIDGALNISWQETDQLITAIGTDKQRPVVVYCRSGNRSEKAKAALETEGYTHIFNANGFEALKESKP